LTRQQTLLKLSLSVIDYTLYFLMGYWWLSIWGLPISSLLAGAGLAGLAIGLGAQGFLNDLINGFFILLERQFDVGDIVTIQSVTGKVVNLGIRTTQIQGRDGSLHFIPNRSITLVSNLSRNPALITINLPLAFATDTEKVANCLASVTAGQWQSYSGVLEEPRLVGPVLSAWENHVFRVEILVENDKKLELYQTFYKLYQKALITEGLAQEKETTTHD
jgi:small conductance mechanosensitive channel